MLYSKRLKKINLHQELNPGLLFSRLVCKPFHYPDSSTRPYFSGLATSHHVMQRGKLFVIKEVWFVQSNSPDTESGWCSGSAC